MAKKTTFKVASSMKRGDDIARGGNLGKFIGVDKTGHVWIAWGDANFERMCWAFDLANK